MTGAPRVVLDTNTLVSTLLFRPENWAWLRGAWKESRLIPLMCGRTTLEMITVLNYPKFKLGRSDQDLLLAEILPFAETCPDPKHRPSLASCRDPKDQVFLELALESHADYLVSGDRDLLEYSGAPELKIISPTSFRALLSPF